MNNKWIGLILIGIAILVSGSLVQAEKYKGRTELGIQGGSIFFEGDENLNEDEIYGARIGHYLTDNLSLEASLLYGKTENTWTKRDTEILIPMGEILYHFGRSRFRPFLGVGAGMLGLNPQYSNDITDFAVQYGGGVKWLVTRDWLVRLDARHLIDTEIGEPTHNAIATAGLSWLFGCSAKEEKPVQVVQKVEEAQTVVAPPPPADSDNDGVIDTQDACPGTPTGVQVDERGCPKPAPKLVPQKEWVLKGVTFETNSDKIKADSYGPLDEAAGILKDNPNVTVEIQGHTDSTGSAAVNQSLSEKRAVAVKSYLVGKGIDAARLSAKGYGSSVPIGDNKTADGRSQNRRIEFRVLTR